MTLQDLTQLVALGEGSFIEFKRKVPQPARLAKEVTAFANTHGGQVLLGVDDDGTITGVRDAEETEFALRQALDNHCEPPVLYSLLRVPISRRRDVLCIQVPESTAKPHFVVDRANGQGHTAYVRVNDMSVGASKEARQLMRNQGREGDVTFEFGEKELMLMRYLDHYGRVTVKQFAKLAHIPPWRASKILVRMARANVLRLQAGREEDYFTLAYKADA